MKKQNISKTTSTNMTIDDGCLDNLLPEIERELVKVNSHLLLIPIWVTISAIYLLIWFTFGL